MGRKVAHGVWIEVNRKVNLVHCSYHKCLTVYYARVIATVYDKLLHVHNGYRHFNSSLSEFYRAIGEYRIASINNHVLDFGRLGDFRISRFVRDPRDLVVSGYYYHRQGLEAWCTVVGPTDKDWEVVNGSVPRKLGSSESYSSYLRNVSEEEGLIAEVEFRRRHFESMLEWPKEDPRIQTIRYEDVIGHEGRVFRDLLAFYGAGRLEGLLGQLVAAKYSARRQMRRSRHIRDPKPNQWRMRFTPKVEEFFNRQYRDLVGELGYSLE
jgi:hypothetical protein